MQIVIDIPDNMQEMCKWHLDGIDELANLEIQIIAEAIRDGVAISDNATNGDVIKALFPDGSQVKGASIYVMRNNKTNIFYDFDWWNAPYKVGDTNGNS